MNYSLRESVAAKSRQIRIIGGEMRSRKLTFPAVNGLRPSPDRVRETVFNWLQHKITGSYGLDLFAGSGAFGFEAISRGAAGVTMVESNSTVIRSLQTNCKTLHCEDILHIVNDKVENFLHVTEQRYDIIFADPPFQSSICETILPLIAESQVVKDRSLIYLELPRYAPPLSMPMGWHIIKNQIQGQVQSTLISTTDDL